MTETQSPEIKELAAALAKAQGELKNPIKDSANPFFKSKYTDLAGHWDVCRAVLAKNGLSVVQTTTVLGEQREIALVTTLAHSSGQWIRGCLPICAAKQDPQGIGAAITYARRAALSAIVGTAPEDDDGETAMGRGGAAPPPAASKPQPINTFTNPQTTNPGDCVIPYGTLKGTKLRDHSAAVLTELVTSWENGAKEAGRPLSGEPLRLVNNCKAYLTSLSSK